MVTYFGLDVHQKKMMNWDLTRAGFCFEDLQFRCVKVSVPGLRHQATLIIAMHDA